MTDGPTDTRRGEARAVLGVDPLPGGICRVCSHELPKGSLRCAHCGATYGEVNRCPHCRAVADAEPDDVVGQVCRVCGGPRVMVDDAAVERSGREQPLLERMRSLRGRRAAFGIASGLATLIGLGMLGISLLVVAIFDPTQLVSAVLGGAVLVPLITGALTFRQASRARREIEKVRDQAYELVAADVLKSRGALPPAELARILRTTEGQAENLLARLQVEDYLGAGSDAQGKAKLRVDDGDVPADPPSDGGRTRARGESQ